MDPDNFTYLVFFGSLALGVLLGFTLPDALHVTQETAEEWVMAGLFPIMLWTVWRLRGEAPAAPVVPAPSPELRKQ